MKLIIRKLNRGEAYACRAQDAKALFGEEPDDVLVLFGLWQRQHTFDGQDRRHPRIDGEVVARASVNFRDGNGVGVMMSPPNYFFSFYAIAQPYSDAMREEFVARCLPAMWEWYRRQRVRPDTALSGVEVLLVVMGEQGFRLHEYRFH